MMMELDSLSMEVLLDHYKHPHNAGEIKDADITHEEGNPSCGDQLKFYIKIKDGIIEDIKFKGKGCIISQASASLLTDDVIGKRIDDAKKFTKEDILDMLGIPIGPMRLKCALLPLKVLKIGLYGLSQWNDEDEEVR